MLDSKYNSSWFQQKIEAITEKYLLNNFSANQVTLIGLILGILSASCIFVYSFIDLPSGFQSFLQQFWNTLLQDGFSASWKWISTQEGIFGWRWRWGDTLLTIAALLMILSFTADIFDGTLARLSNQTIFGGIFDIFADRFVEIILLISIISISPRSLLWPGLISFAAIIECITIFLLVGGVVTEEKIQKFTKQKKIIYYTSGLMERTETFLFIFFILCISPLRVYLLWLFAILIWITAFQRFYHAFRLFYPTPVE